MFSVPFRARMIGVGLQSAAKASCVASPLGKNAILILSTPVELLFKLFKHEIFMFVPYEPERQREKNSSFNLGSQLNCSV